MSSKSQTSPLLLFLILLITFPFWITIGAVLIGVAAGLFGALVGIIGAIVGVLVAVIVLPFKILFGWDDWGFHGWNGVFHLHHNTYLVLAVILIAVLIVRRQRSS